MCAERKSLKKYKLTYIVLYWGEKEASLNMVMEAARSDMGRKSHLDLGIAPSFDLTDFPTGFFLRKIVYGFSAKFPKKSIRNSGNDLSTI